jgi:hypothetical protein
MISKIRIKTKCTDYARALCRRSGIKNEYGTGSVWYCEGRKELAYTIVRLELILFSEETGPF